jgi:hypothetical protein
MTRSHDPQHRPNPDQRQALPDRYRKVRDPEVRFRAHILLPLADGYTWATVATILFWSSRTIDRRVKRYLQQGIEALGGQKRGRPFPTPALDEGDRTRWRRQHHLWSNISQVVRGAVRPLPRIRGHLESSAR